MTSLKTAIASNDIEEVKKLLKKGANANERIDDSEGWDSCAYNVLHLALGTKEKVQTSTNKELNYQLITLLLEHGADINSTYSQGGWMLRGVTKSAFQVIIDRLFASPTQELYDLFKYALQKGANPNGTISTGGSTMRTDSSSKVTLLTRASSNPRVLQILLAASADPNAFNRKRVDNEYGYMEDTKSTALHCVLVSSGENYKALSLLLLLHHGADVELRKQYIEQVEIPKPEASIGIDDPREDGYHSGLRNVRVMATPLNIALEQKELSKVLILRMYGASIKAPLIKDSELTSCMEIIDGLKQDEELKELKKLALKHRWHPRLHLHFPRVFRDQVFFLMLCLNRAIQAYIPPELLQYIVSIAADQGCFSPSLVFDMDKIFDAEYQQ